MLKLSLQLLLLSHAAHSMLLGWVESPGYPSGYSPHSSLNWSRCAPKGHVVSIRLIHLDLEDSQNCENDVVMIFSNGTQISMLCGKREFEELQSTVNPTLHSSPGGCLSLTFQSDYSNTKRHTGFRGFYTLQDFDECMDDARGGCTQFCHNFIGGYHCSCRRGYHLGADKKTCTVSCSEDLSGRNTGVITSPSWPGSYAENANCQYSLLVEDQLQLELHFSDDFDVEQSSDGQCIDALRIETPSGTLGPFCGHTPPPSPLFTHSNQIKIHFVTDTFGNNRGFSIHYKTTDKVCPAVVTPHSVVSPEQPEYPQGEKVKVTCDVGYVVNTLGRQSLVSEYETTCQRTGIWTPRYTCEPVNCGLPVIPRNGILMLVGSNNPHTQYKDQIQFNCSSKYYTLEGDDTFTCTAAGEWESVSGNSEMPKCKEVCGRPETTISKTSRILGGENAKLGEIPWHLLIKEPSRGGASLISDQWAVTAAHVVENVDERSLRLYGGLIDGRATMWDPKLRNQNNVVALESEKIIIHPNYVKGVPTNFDNDIALIRLASRVNLGPNIVPICLPEVNTDLLEGEQGTVSGWGMAERGVSAMLKHTTISVYSQTECTKTPYLSPNNPMVFTNNMFCAGAEGRDSCEKDSGGPFVSPMLTGGRRPFHLTGIVSWGSPCRERKFKGYYTKVENYVDWIKETIERTEKSLEEDQ
ncbi:complement C1s subcomponent [Aulostomus maculatus]